MRKFYLENETGNRTGLNGESGIRLSDPAGLGVSYGSTFADLEEGFFIETKQKTPQAAPTGSLYFTSSAYQRYQDFTDWVMAAKKLYLVYAPLNKEYYREVRLSYLTKTELTATKWLEVPMELDCLTPWYLPTPLALNFASDTDTAMRYEYTYDDALVYGERSGGAYSVEIPARGHVPAALRVTYAGAAADIEISLTGLVSGREYGRCKISGDIAATDTLELYTGKRDSYVKKTAANGTETDLLYAGMVDITAEPFFRAPVDEASILALTGVGTLSGAVAAQAYFYYRSV